MLNKLPETSSRENQHQSFHGSDSCREWEEEQNWLAQTEMCCCCKGYPVSPLFSLGFVKMHVISAFSLHSTYLTGLSFYAIDFLTDGSSTRLDVRLFESKQQANSSLQELGPKKRHLKVSTKGCAGLPQTLTPPSAAIARGRSFYSFLTALKDLMLPGFLYQKCIKLAQGLLFSVASILQSCHTYFLSSCSHFFF